jgi:hypothetical protein
MNKEDNYRRHAVDLFRLAQKASTPVEKGRLLALAEAWLDLTDRSMALVNRYRRRFVRVLPVKDHDQGRSAPD